MIQFWKNLFFLHFSLDPIYLQSHLPDHVTLDLYNNKAYLGIVGFEMKSIHFKGIPYLRYPSFYELNLRTYVMLPDAKPAIYFFSLDANSLLSVLLARVFFKLPYHFYGIRYSFDSQSGRMQSQKQDESLSDFSFKLSKIIANDPLAFFLLERYHFITAQKKRYYVGSLTHEIYNAVHLETFDYTPHLFQRFSIDENKVVVEPQACYFCSGFEVQITEFGRI